MRRLIAIALTALMLLSAFSVGVFSTTASAAEVGSVDSGYTPSGTPITSAEEFLAMEEDGDYYLANDIEIDRIYGVAYDGDDIMFGDDGTMIVEMDFSGTLDGNGKTVTVSVPMFANLNGATVKNMSIEGEIDFRSDSGMDIQAHCGTVAMEGTDITVENIVNNADVLGFETAMTVDYISVSTGEPLVRYDSIYSGGILGSVYGDLTVTDCENNGSITALVAGGIVGSLKKVPKSMEDENGDYKATRTAAVFTNCYNSGLISDTDCHDLMVQEGNEMVRKKTGLAAGIISYAVATTIDFVDCKNDGDILSQETQGGVSGGIAGRILQSDSSNPCDVTFTNCVNEGEVVGWSQIGGIGGFIQCSVSCINCENHGSVTSRNNYAAGIIGRPGVDYYPSALEINFDRCINTGTVTGHRQYAGGITSYSIDRTYITRCINMGDIVAEGATEDSDDNSHGHPIQCAGIVVNVSQSINLQYCVNTGNIISNYRAAGIAGQAGSGKIAGVNFTGGYNTMFACLNTGNVSAYNEKHGWSTFQDTNGDGMCDDVTYDICGDSSSDTDDPEDKDKDGDGICDSCGCTVGVDRHWHYYSNNNSAGILGYSYGSGNAQAPRIIGCGVTGNVTNSHYGAVCAFMGYANTDFAMIQGNYFLGTLSGPSETSVIHQVTKSKDYCLEYATTWIDRCDSQKYVKKNYYYESIASSGYMLMQNNGTEVGFNAYDCYVTIEDVASGKLCYLVNKASYDFMDVYPFLQRLGYDEIPLSPYYYLNDDNTIDYTYWVDEDGAGGYKNVLFVPEEKPADSESDSDSDTDPVDPGTDPVDPGTDPVDPGTDPVDPGTDPVDPGTDPVDPGVTDPVDPVDSGTNAPADGGNEGGGGCGSVVGASIALAALALIAPAGIMLKKRDEE